MKNSRPDDIAKRFQFLEKVYILASRKSDRPNMKTSFSSEKVGELLGYDKLQSISITDQLAAKKLAKKVVVGPDKIGIKIAPGGVKTIENIIKQREVVPSFSRKEMGRAPRDSSFYFFILFFIVAVVFVALIILFDLV
ncbi:hypothetical protein HOG98_06870 [bacterium]|jgi:hypothetical protein|nr:hypothetical protein [bacterium]